MDVRTREKVMKATLSLTSTLIVGLLALQASAQSTSPNVTVLPSEKQVQAIQQATKKSCREKKDQENCEKKTKIDKRKKTDPKD